MRLLRYRITNFRSVANSGWLETVDVTALIGVNESGKSNLLLPLWNLGQGWNVELSKRVKQHLLAIRVAVVKQEHADRWKRLSETLESSAANSRG